MAITGDGTQENPWRVHNMAEIIEVGQKYNEHALLENDVDVSKEYERISEVRMDCKLDLGGHAIKNILANGTFMFSPNWGEIKNGKILNIFCERNINIFHGAYVSRQIRPLGFENVAISINIDSLRDDATTYSAMCQYASLKNCNVYVSGSDTNPVALFRDSSIADSRIELDFSHYTDIAPFVRSDPSDSAIEGRISGILTNSDWKGVNLKGGFWNVDTRGLANAENLIIKGTGMVNTELSPNTTIAVATIKTRTTNEILSPAYNNSNGFPVEEVI